MLNLQVLLPFLPDGGAEYRHRHGLPFPPRLPPGHNLLPEQVGKFLQPRTGQDCTQVSMGEISVNRASIYYISKCCEESL